MRMMTDDDTLYLRQAADAQNYAERARTEEDRRAWLRLAQAWLGLIRPRAAKAEQAKAEAGRLPCDETNCAAAASPHYSG